jgi:hypothetical protein
LKNSFLNCEIATKFFENSKASIVESLLISLNTGEVKQFSIQPLQSSFKRFSDFLETEINNLEIKIEMTDQYELTNDVQFEKKKNVPQTLQEDYSEDLESK